MYFPNTIMFYQHRCGTLRRVFAMKTFHAKKSEPTLRSFGRPKAATFEKSFAPMFFFDKFCQHLPHLSSNLRHTVNSINQEIVLVIRQSILGILKTLSRNLVFQKCSCYKLSTALSKTGTRDSLLSTNIQD